MAPHTCEGAARVRVRIRVRVARWPQIHVRVPICCQETGRGVRGAWVCSSVVGKFRKGFRIGFTRSRGYRLERDPLNHIR